VAGLAALSLVVGLAGCVAPRAGNPQGRLPSCVSELDAPLPGIPAGEEQDAAALERLAASAEAAVGRGTECLQRLRGASGPEGDLQALSNAAARQERRLAELQELRHAALFNLQVLGLDGGGAAKVLDPAEVVKAEAAAPFVELTRYPAIEAPDEVDPGEELDVQVLLAEERISDQTTVEVTNDLKQAGALDLKFPALADGEVGWEVTVVLTAEGLTVRGKNSQTFLLPRSGSSLPVRFKVRAGKKARQGALFATFYRETSCLGRARRAVQVGAAPAVAQGPSAATASRPEAGAPPRAQLSTYADGQRPFRAPDLSIAVRTGSDPLLKHRAEVIVSALRKRGGAETGAWNFPDDLARVLTKDYVAFANRSARDLVEEDTPRPPPTGEPKRTKALVHSFGRDQWERLPEVIRRALRVLDEESKAGGETIEIVTNEPLFPWELVALPSGRLLGQKFAVARFHHGPDGQDRRPPPQLRVDGVALLAPSYAGARQLKAQLAEVEAVRAAAGGGRAKVLLREELGKVEGLERTLEQDRQAGAYVFHFAGHGRTSPEGAGDYQLDLGQEGLSAREWGELITGGRAPPFLFLNACNLAKVEQVAGLVDGWAPKSIRAGVTGYIGGLWPIGDRAASEAAGLFYVAAFEGVPVAEALRRVRLRFDQTGDPTFLAYVYYGDPDLRLEVRPR